MRRFAFIQHACIFLTAALLFLGGCGAGDSSSTERNGQAAEQLIDSTLPTYWDTSWYLSMQSSSAVDAYFQKRASQGFQVVMFGAVYYTGGTAALGQGGAPFPCGNVTCPNDAAFQYIGWMIDDANAHGLIPAVLPMGNIGTSDHVSLLQSTSAAYAYGQYLAGKFKSKNLIWVLGGDDCPTQDSTLQGLVDNLGKGIRAGGATQRMTVHTNSLISGWCTGTAAWFGNDSWLTFDMIQTRGSYTNSTPVATAVRSDYYGNSKATGIGESNYEGAESAAVVRADAYRAFLAGASYYTYGSAGSCCDDPVAVDSAGITYTQIARSFVKSRGWQNYAPDQSFVTAYSGERVAMIQGSTHAMVYLASSSSNATIDMSRLCGGGGSVQVSRFNPVTGGTSSVGSYSCSSGTRVFDTGGLSDAVILLDPGSNASSINFVQQNGIANFTSPSTTLSTSFTSSLGAGHAVIATVGGSSSAASQVTDSLGNVYQLAVQDQETSIFYAKNVKGGSDTVKATFSTASEGTLTIHEYSGLDPSSPLDKVASGGASSGTAVSTNSATTTSKNELIFGFTAVDHNSAAGSGFTLRLDNEGNSSEDKVVSATGSYDVTFTQSMSGSWTALMATFRGAGQ